MAQQNLARAVAKAAVHVAFVSCRGCVAHEEHAPKRDCGEDGIEPESSGADRGFGGAQSPAGEQSC